MSETYLADINAVSESTLVSGRVSAAFAVRQTPALGQTLALGQTPAMGQTPAIGRVCAVSRTGVAGGVLGGLQMTAAPKQTHRDLGRGVLAPVAFKISTDGWASLPRRWEQKS